MTIIPKLFEVLNKIFKISKSSKAVNIEFNQEKNYINTNLALDIQSIYYIIEIFKL